MASATGVRQNVSLAPRFRPRLLPIMDGYILREMAGPFVFGLAGFLLFWFVNIFILAADYVINKGAPVFLVLRFLVFRVPQATPLAFPFACLFGTLLAFGRLVSDNEITAMRTSGISFMRIVRTPLLAGIAIFAGSYAINEQVVPHATDLSTRTFYQIIYKTATLPIDPRIFRQDPSTGRTFYVERVLPDGKTMQNVMIFEPGRTGAFVTTTTAQQARIDQATLTMINAVQTRFKADGSVDSVVRGLQLTVGLPIGETAQNFLSSAYNDPYTMDSKTLAQDIRVRQATGQGGTDVQLRKITLAQKLANPFAAFIAVVISLPLAVRFGKKGRALGFGLSILVLFVYFALNSAAAAFGKNGSIDPYLAAWFPNIVFALIGGAMIVAEER